MTASGECHATVGESSLVLEARPARGGADTCGDQAKLVASVGGLGTTKRHGVALTTRPAGAGVVVVNSSSSFDAYLAAEADACNGAEADAAVTKVSAAWAATWAPPKLSVSVTTSSPAESTVAQAWGAAGGPAPATNGTLSDGAAAVYLSGVGTVAGASSHVYRLVDFAFSDSYGDGWNGAKLHVSPLGSDESSYSGTLHNGHGKLDEALLVAGCYDIGVTAGSFAGEISWAACDGVVSGTAPATEISPHVQDRNGGAAGARRTPSPRRSRRLAGRLHRELRRLASRRIPSARRATRTPRGSSCHFHHRPHTSRGT